MARGELTNPSANRCLDDKAMDHIDHALGRPVDPMRKTYRNHFVTDGAEADAFAASAHWEEIGGPPSSMRAFRVTEYGRAVLAVHLKTLPNPHRRFEITFDGASWIVAAASAAKARHAEWLSVCDLCPDLTFIDFCRSAKIRRLA